MKWTVSTELSMHALKLFYLLHDPFAALLFLCCFTWMGPNRSLQKQISCFNDRVVTLVVDKLKRLWLCIVHLADCIRKPESKLPRLYILHQNLVVSNH